VYGYPYTINNQGRMYAALWFGRRTEAGQTSSDGTRAVGTDGLIQGTLRMQNRVLYAVNLDPSKKYGSLEEQIFLLAMALSREGGLLLPVFTREMGDKQIARYRDAGLPVTWLDLRRFNTISFLRLIRLLDRHAIQVIHWNLYHPANGYAALLRLIRPKIKHYLTDHNSRLRACRRAEGGIKNVCRRMVTAGYSRVFAVSDYVLSDLKEQAVWHTPRRWHHFVNTDRFRPDETMGGTLRASLGCEQDFVILVVAHLIPEKGVEVAIRALAGLPPRAVLWIVGDGRHRPALQQLAQSLGVERRITFFGLHSEVCQFMQAADCLVCPSLWQEAAGLVILEAMACGLPVIGSEVGGIPEFIISGETGYLFPAGDHTALAERLRCLSDSPAQSREMRRQARAQALTKFSHRTRVTDALLLYE
jgi:glycosyltransferase involved in cell wall biosynthesis